MHLKDKVAVVLGASAAAGTGWAIAERYAAEGAKVVVAARREAQLGVLARRIGGVSQVCDLAKEQDIKALAERVLDVHGRVDIAVNAAGIPMGGTIADTPHDQTVRSIEVNYYGNLFFVKHMAAAMAQGGSIILFSSMASTHALEHVYSYACAKAATDCLVRYAALEYGKRGIKVNSILPGAIRSEMSHALWAIEDMERAWAREVPLGRIGTPADFADAAVWLGGPSFVTGLNLQVNGGNHLTRFPLFDERPSLDGVDPTA
ncbi:SDR family oxidoreductase [Pseudomonas putida]|uniref:SDR family NAD(P)-dependent oxidoreductase n=1 Tax=Pseudomonas putida TaxID=303 RepID=UPI002364A080|nr:SDR family oxidoreductase [Pseudomonas putida]MDD2068721.1 SDR family oxidoreductase [Pseudomonas putida]HDS1738654.1 SDR family oxidoreductase [Pseudomonas putida]